jgi:small GTP-binding protein
MRGAAVNEKLKICMVGATAVGKTSLVERYVTSIFRDRYATTIGVKIQTRRVRSSDREVDMILWDLSGQDEFQNVRPEYLRGASGYLVVIDGTRRETVDTAISLQEVARVATHDAPFVAVLNKSDLVATWELDAPVIDTLHARRWPILRASAKTGEGVEAAFDTLVRAIDRRRGEVWISSH